MTAVSEETGCLNCGAELRGEYCHACGQRTSSTHLGLHEVFEEVTHEFLHLDGKILTTLKVLVTRPGQLTKDIVDGRRARYITALRLYLTTSVLFFLLNAVVPNPGAQPINVTLTDDNGKVITTLTPEQQRQTDAIRATTLTSLPKLVFVLMPAFALVTMVFYRRLQPHYVAHLYYSLNAHAFAFLVFAVVMPFRVFGTVPRAVADGTGFVWLVAYYYLSFRRFYGQSWPRTIVKGTAIAVLYAVVIVLGMLALFNIVFKIAH